MLQKHAHSATLLPRSMDQCALISPSQLPGEYTTQAAVEGATKLSFTCPSHPSGYLFSAG